MERQMYAATRYMEDRLWWYAGMRRISEHLLDRYVGAGPLDILDAGCGTGGAATWLARRGRVTGVDLSDVALGYCLERGLKGLVRASINCLPFAPEQFDLVTSFDVLYHQWVDDAAALAEFARVLRPGGHLLLRVAAHDWLRGAHDHVTCTRQRYSLPEVRARLARAGLEVLVASYANGLLFPVAVARRLLARSERSDDFWLPPALLNALLGHLLGLETELIIRSALPLGLSVVALARKPKPSGGG